MCDKAASIKPYLLKFFPDHLLTEEMCLKAVGKNPEVIGDFPDQYKTKRHKRYIGKT